VSSDDMVSAPVLKLSHRPTRQTGLSSTGTILIFRHYVELRRLRQER
jgi:hypothetical protein